jgi:PilZ domain
MADIKPAPPGSAGETAGEHRRSQRVQIVMPVLVRGEAEDKPFEENAFTNSISANGCMLLMSRVVTRNQQIRIVNPKTAEELPCRVAFLGKRMDGKTEVGLEFAEASPLFWRIAFPPEDWDPAERKRAGPPGTPLKPARK